MDKVKPREGDWGPWVGIDPTTRKRTNYANPIWYSAGDTERAVVFQPGYHTDRETYGLHGMDITWLLRGPRGATQFSMSTGWVPELGLTPGTADLFPMALDLSYHALCPQYPNAFGPRDCGHLPGGRCWYDGSTLNAEPVMNRFLVEGEHVIWQYLSEYYDELKVPEDHDSHDQG